ncbi:MAG: trigger factor [Patescibacteria group bacterium]
MKKDKEKLNNRVEIPIKLANYKGLRIKKNELKVTKEEIDKSLDYLQTSRAKIITVNKPAEKGNRIEVDFEIRQGGAKIEDGISKNHPLILGESRFLPGFEEKLEGMKAGQEKEFSLKVPANWPDKRIADKNLDFKVKMKIVQERELPLLNDEFAKSLGKFDSLEILKDSIKEGLLEEKEIKEKERIRIELITRISEESKINVPLFLVEQELERMINEFKISINTLGLDFEKYLKGINKTINEIKKDWQKQAEKRVRIAVCLKAIADKENIEVNDEEVKERINHDLKHYSSMEEVEKNIDLDTLKEYTKEVLRNEKVFGLIEKEAKIIT